MSGTSMSAEFGELYPCIEKRIAELEARLAALEARWPIVYYPYPTTYPYTYPNTFTVSTTAVAA